MSSREAATSAACRLSARCRSWSAASLASAALLAAGAFARKPTGGASSSASISAIIAASWSDALVCATFSALRSASRRSFALLEAHARKWELENLSVAAAGAHDAPRGVEHGVAEHLERIGGVRRRCQHAGRGGSRM